MGAPKLLALLAGRPLISHAVDAALQSQADAVFVVTGASADEVRTALGDCGARFVDNRAWASGLASSIGCGIRAAHDFDAAVLLLGDQPTLRPETLDALIEHYRAGRPLAACEYQDGTIGPPALFDRSHYEALLELTGDAGAKAVLRGKSATIVPFPTGTLDVDTPEDLERARTRARDAS